jgi:hypothetical protein
MRLALVQRSAGQSIPKRVRINGARGRWVAERGRLWLAVLHHALPVGADCCETPIMPEHTGGKRPGACEQPPEEDGPAGIKGGRTPFHRPFMDICGYSGSKTFSSIAGMGIN